MRTTSDVDPVAEQTPLIFKDVELTKTVGTDIPHTWTTEVDVKLVPETVVEKTPNGICDEVPAAVTEGTSVVERMITGDTATEITAHRANRRILRPACILMKAPLADGRIGAQQEPKQSYSDAVVQRQMIDADDRGLADVVLGFVVTGRSPRFMAIDFYENVVELSV